MRRTLRSAPWRVRWRVMWLYTSPRLVSTISQRYTFMALSSRVRPAGARWRRVRAGGPRCRRSAPAVPSGPCGGCRRAGGRRPGRGAGAAQRSSAGRAVRRPRPGSTRRSCCGLLLVVGDGAAVAPDERGGAGEASDLHARHRAVAVTVTAVAVHAPDLAAPPVPAQAVGGAVLARRWERAGAAGQRLPPVGLVDVAELAGGGDPPAHGAGGVLHLVVVEGLGEADDRAERRAGIDVGAAARLGGAAGDPVLKVSLQLARPGVDVQQHRRRFSVPGGG